MDKNIEKAKILIEAASILNEDCEILNEIGGAIDKLSVIKFLRKYNYKGDNKKGIITWKDGNKFKVDIRIKDLIVKSPDGKDVSPRNTSIFMERDDSDKIVNKIIIIDDAFARLTPSQKDAFIAHEIGHYYDSKNMKQNDYIENNKYSDFKQRMLRKNIDIEDRARKYPDSGLAKFVNKYKQSENDKKHEIKGTHTNLEEFRADRYAASVTSEKDLVDALEAYAKNIMDGGKRTKRQIQKEIVASKISKNSPLSEKTIERLAKNSAKRIIKNEKTINAEKERLRKEIETRKKVLNNSKNEQK